MLLSKMHHGQRHTYPQLKDDRSAKPGLPCTAQSSDPFKRYYLNPETLGNSQDAVYAADTRFPMKKSVLLC